jgi:hypothetical protein
VHSDIFVPKSEKNDVASLSLYNAEVSSVQEISSILHCQPKEVKGKTSMYQEQDQKGYIL